jgi:hypothetical protein
MAKLSPPPGTVSEDLNRLLLAVDTDQVRNLMSDARAQLL